MSIDRNQIEADIAEGSKSPWEIHEVRVRDAARQTCVQHAAALLDELDRVTSVLGRATIKESREILSRHMHATPAGDGPDYLAIGRAELERIATDA